MSGALRARLERMRNSPEIGVGTNKAKMVSVSRTDFIFPGEEYFVETAVGPCYYRQKTFSLQSFHGSGPLADLLACSGADLTLPAKDEALRDIAPQNALFLDIETTGLSGGTGTWVVLIGLGWCQGEQFYLRQYFLMNPAQEKAMLLHLSETVANFPGLVTFNGRTFDVPLLQTRYVLAGQSVQPMSSFHIDLLHCSRRLWKERLGSCNLRALEMKLLGLQRIDDIPGEEIPSIYFNYLRTGDTTRLRDIFEHNVLDILSMVRLLVLVARAGAGQAPNHAADFYALGKLYIERSRINEAITCYQRAASCGDTRFEVCALLRLSFIYKRCGMWQEAKAIWDELVRRQCSDVTPYLELAKYYEHRAKNYQAALAMTEHVLTCKKRRISLPLGGQLNDLALGCRRERLLKKAMQ